LIDGLLAGLVNLTEPAFVSWLGVAFYLPAETVLSTRGDMGSFPAGSESSSTISRRRTDSEPRRCPASKLSESRRPPAASHGRAISSRRTWPRPSGGAKLGKLEDLDSEAMAARYVPGAYPRFAPTGPMRFVCAQIGAEP
jgi:hypothetical protein